MLGPDRRKCAVALALVLLLCVSDGVSPAGAPPLVVANTTWLTTGMLQAKVSGSKPVKGPAEALVEFTDASGPSLPGSGSFRMTITDPSPTALMIEGAYVQDEKAKIGVTTDDPALADRLTDLVTDALEEQGYDPGLFDLIQVSVTRNAVKTKASSRNGELLQVKWKAQYEVLLVMGAESAQGKGSLSYNGKGTKSSSENQR